MNATEFDNLTTNIWSPYLQGELGFEFAEGAFCRELDGGIRQVILLDFDVRNAKTFRVIVGFNSSFIAGSLSSVDAGVFGVRYLDDRVLSGNPKSFPCFSREAAEKSLLQTLSVIKDFVIPWFGNYMKVEDLVGVIEEQYPFIKGKLLFHAGQHVKAKSYLVKHLEFLVRQQQTPSVVQGMNETQEMLKLCI